MFSQSYTSSNLQKFITKKDVISLGISSEQLKAAIDALSTEITMDRFEFGKFQIAIMKQKRHYSPKRISDNWVLRKLNHNLLRLYKVKQANRFLIVKQVASLIKEQLPMTILQFDIKDFYESLDKKAILDKVLSDSLLSYHSKRLLKKVLAAPGLNRYKGLPRGICLSPTLSELAMRDFDRQIRQLDGVYYYARYVDDIILFVYRDPQLVRTALAKALPKGLRLNAKKSDLILTVKACRCNPTCSCGQTRCKCFDKCKCVVNALSMQELEYLGYCFRFSDLAKDRQMTISIAKKKLRKIKTRIVHAFLAHAKENNFALLKKRIMFLTGNHFIEKGADRSGLKAGIYYNYPLITDKSCLSDLGEFLRSIAFSRANSFGIRIGQHLTLAQRRILASHSFLFGFDKRVIHGFAGTTIREIKRCWSYEHH